MLSLLQNRSRNVSLKLRPLPKNGLYYLLETANRLLTSKSGSCYLIPSNEGEQSLDASVN